MEDAVSTCRNSLVTEHTAWANDTDRKRHLLHCAYLNRRCVGTEKHRIIAVIDEESILHLTSRVLWREVKSLEYMPVILYLRAFSHIVAELAEDADDLLSCDGYRVA